MNTELKLLTYECPPLPTLLSNSLPFFIILGGAILLALSKQSGFYLVYAGYLTTLIGMSWPFIPFMTIDPTDPVQSIITVYETKTVGIQIVFPITNAGEEGSQAVYPLASNVFLIPQLGKLDASGSCCTKREPSKRSMLLPPCMGSKKASCFSAVAPVNGWNQCV